MNDINPPNENPTSQSFEPYLVIRIFAAAYCRKNVPEEIDGLEQAEVWAASFARQVHKRVCLVWSRQEIVYFNCEGQIEQRSASSKPPTMTIDGNPIHFELNEPE